MTLLTAWEYVVWNCEPSGKTGWFPGAALHREGGPARTVVRTDAGVPG